MLVRFNTILDGDELIVKLRANRSGLAVLTEDIAVTGIRVIDTFNRRDDCSSTACACFLKCGELLQRNLATLNLHA